MEKGGRKVRVVKDVLIYCTAESIIWRKISKEEEREVDMENEIFDWDIHVREDGFVTCYVLLETMELRVI